jgi:probable F420-dependent oxidoreductase
MTAETLGFESVWVGDHVAMPQRFTSAYPYSEPELVTVEGARRFYDPIVTLAWFAARTSRVRLGLGTSVLVVPRRNPLLPAKQLATLDDQASGRLDLGIGAGWLGEESSAPYAPFVGRGAATAGFIGMMRELWSGDSVRSTCPPYRFRGSSIQPVPAQSQAIPIWVGGHNPGALRRTIELGDAWHALNIDVESFRHGVDQLRAMAWAARRTLPSPTTLCELRIGGEPEPEYWRLPGSADAMATNIGHFGAAGCFEDGTQPAARFDG